MYCMHMYARSLCRLKTEGAFDVKRNTGERVLEMLCHAFAHACDQSSGKRSVLLPSETEREVARELNSTSGAVDANVNDSGPPSLVETYSTSPDVTT